MKNRLAIAIALAALASLATACGGKESKNPSDPSSLVIAWDNTPQNLDPRVGADIASGRIADLVQAGLVRVTAAGDYAPDLAESWETPDDRTVVFHLRPGLQFHDGRGLTAKDVKFTYDSMMADSFVSPKKSGYAAVESIEARDDRTVVFHLREPNGGILDNLTVGIVPSGADTNVFKTAPIGAGPYRVVANVPDERVELEAFDHYHGGAPKIRKVVFRIIPDATTRMLELRRGSVNFEINSIPLDSVKEFERVPDLKVATSPGSRYEYMAFNLKNHYLKNLKVRQAIAHAIDREKIVRDLLRGYAHVTDSMFPTGHWARADALPTHAYDVAAAKRLLDEAGFEDPDGNGPKMRFTLVYKTSQDMEANQRAEMVQQMLREVGIGIEIRSSEFAVFYDDINKGNFELFSLRRGGVSDPDFYYTIFHSASIPPAGQNRGFYSNPRVDELILAGRATFDRTKRKAAYEEIQKIVAEELPYLSLYHLDNVAVMDKRFEGFELHPSGFLDSIASMTVAAEPKR